MRTIGILKTVFGKLLIAALLTLTLPVSAQQQINLATQVKGNLATSHLNSGTGATGTTFWRGDGTWATAGAAPGGVSGDWQYNNAGVLGGFTPGANCQTFIVTPTSANLKACLTDETGNGVVVFNASPVFLSSIAYDGVNIIRSGGLAISSGFGTSPSLGPGGNTLHFTINIGTGGTSSSGVITMPVASNGWSCTVTPNGAPQAGAVTYSTPTSTTSITLTNYTLTTGATLAWTASTILAVSCIGY